MLFTSYEFMLFVAVTLLLYYVIPKKAQWPFLLIANYVFYAICGLSYLPFILATTVTVYLAGITLGKMQGRVEAYIAEHKAELSRDERKAYKAAQKKKQKAVFLLVLLLNLGILAVLKYTNFAIGNVNSLVHAFGGKKQFALADFVLPMGISFYTFQSLGYLIDVYRGKYEPEKNPFRFALFVSFFPQLVQGPISRFDHLAQSLYEKHYFVWERVSRGLQRVLWGYFKKMVIADRMIIGVKTLIAAPDQYRGAYAFFGMLFYALELYADFTGGIDITIGIAEALGIQVTENFHRPYFSKNIKEYWNRWHITMGTWFTDYIFYPISVSKGMITISKFSRKHLGEKIGKRVPVYLSAFAVWFATGIWHGASWNFIVWGLGNFVVIMISQEFDLLFERFRKRFPKLVASRGFDGFRVIRTVLLMSSLRMFDCYRDVPLTFRMFGSMFSVMNLPKAIPGLMHIGLSMKDYIILLVGLLLLFTASMVQRRGSVRDKLVKLPFAVKTVLWLSLFLAIVLFGAYGIGYDASQFIYNQF